MSLFPLDPAERVTVGGRERPHHYTTLSDESRALLNGSSLLDITHLQWLRIRGSDALSFTQGMVTQDTNSIAVGSGASAWVLDSGGKVLWPLVIFRTASDTLLLQTPGDAQAVHAHLDRYHIMESLDLDIMTGYHAISLQGPTVEKHRQASDTDDKLWLCHDRYGSGGYDVLCPDDALPTLCGQLMDHGVIATGLGAVRQVRLERFVIDPEEDSRTGENPVGYGLKGWISHQKGCYVGQETVAMTRDRGKPARVAVRLTADEGQPSKNGPLSLAGKPVGELTTVGRSPVNNRLLAIATLKFSVAKPDHQLLDSNDHAWRLIDTKDYQTT